MGFDNTSAALTAPDASSPAAGSPGKQTLAERRYGKLPPKADFPAPIPLTVNASVLRVRSTPDTSTPDNIIGRQRRGNVVSSQGKDGDWVKVLCEGQVGFMHGQYLAMDAATAKGAAPAAPAAPAAMPTPAAPAPSADAGGGGLLDILDDVFFWLRELTHNGADEESHKPDSKDPAAPTTPEAPITPTDPVAPPPPPAHVPPGAADLADQALAAYLASLSNPTVDSVAHMVAKLEHDQGAAKQHNHEEQGAARDQLVADIGAVRAQIAALSGPGLEQAKAKLYRAVANVAPYYSQGRNVNVLEGESTRTCNITSLAMCLESLGKSAADFSGSQAEVAAAASCSTYAGRFAKGEDRVKGIGALAGMRLPDFLQLVAIAECASGTSEDAIIAGAQKAWSSILSLSFLRTLAKRFGVGGDIHAFTTDTSKSAKDQKKDLDALASFGKQHRKDVEKLVDARNEGSSKYQGKLEDEHAAMEGKGIEDKVSLEDYANAIRTQVGADLDRGAAVVVLISGHYVRLQAIHDDHVIVDDPGQHARANRLVTWAEARAMGYFKQRLVLQ